MQPSEGFGVYFQEQIDDMKPRSVSIWILIFVLVVILLCINLNLSSLITQQKETNIQLQLINQKLHILTVGKSVDRLRVVGS